MMGWESSKQSKTKGNELKACTYVRAMVSELFSTDPLRESESANVHG